jgi:hypothetical protein
MCAGRLLPQLVHGEGNSAMAQWQKASVVRNAPNGSVQAVPNPSAPMTSIAASRARRAPGINMHVCPSINGKARLLFKKSPFFIIPESWKIKKCENDHL